MENRELTEEKCKEICRKLGEKIESGEVINYVNYYENGRGHAPLQNGNQSLFAVVAFKGSGEELGLEEFLAIMSVGDKKNKGNINGYCFGDSRMESLYKESGGSSDKMFEKYPEFKKPLVLFQKTFNNFFDDRKKVLREEIPCDEVLDKITKENLEGKTFDTLNICSRINYKVDNQEERQEIKFYSIIFTLDQSQFESYLKKENRKIEYAKCQSIALNIKAKVLRNQGPVPQNPRGI